MCSILAIVCLVSRLNGLLCEQSFIPVLLLYITCR